MRGQVSGERGLREAGQDEGQSEGAGLGHSGPSGALEPESQGRAGPVSRQAGGAVLRGGGRAAAHLQLGEGCPHHGGLS